MFGALFDGFLAFLILVNLVKYFHLPYLGGPTGIVSAVTRQQFEPLTNYFRYLVIFAGTFSVFFFSYRRRDSFPAPAINKGKIHAVSFPNIWRAACWTILFVVLFSVAINWTATDVSEPVSDTFHEGEFFGFLAAAKQGIPFQDIVSIHGGMDFLPVLIADRHAKNDNRIVLTRLVYVALHILAFLAALVTIYQAARLLGCRLSRFDTICLLLMVWLLLSSILGIRPAPANPVSAACHPYSVRDVLFLLQLSLVLGFFRIAKSETHRATLLPVAAFIGMLLPLSFLYSYDRAIYMLAVTTIVTLCVPAQSRPTAISWLVGLVSGVLLGIGILSFTIGGGGIHGLIRQVAYWGKISRFISTLPLSLGIRDISVLFPFGTGTLAICGGMYYLFLEYRRHGDFRIALGDNMGVVILTVASVVFMRIAMERSDPIHILWGLMPSFLFIAAAVLVFLDRLFRDTGLIDAVSTAGSGAQALVVMSLALLVLTPVASPKYAASVLWNYRNSVSLQDSKLLPADYVAAVGALKKEIQSSAAFFTLTNEGVWYYLFETPSCSRFHQLFYARDTAAQKEVIDSLEQKQPRVILFQNVFWSNRIDNVSVFNSNAPVVRFVLENYRPFRVIGEHWFWCRSEHPMRFGTEMEGSLDANPQTVDRTRDMEFSGNFREGFHLTDVSAIIATVGEENIPVWAGRLSKEDAARSRWTATLPTATLGAGATLIRFWVMENLDTTLHPLGDGALVAVQ